MKKEISLSLLVIMLFLSMPGCSTSRMWNEPHPVKVQRQPLPASALHIANGSQLLLQQGECYFFFQSKSDAGTNDLLQSIETATSPVSFYYNGIHIDPDNNHKSYNNVFMQVNMSTENTSTDFMLKGEVRFVGLTKVEATCVQQEGTKDPDLLIVTDKLPTLEVIKRTAYTPAYVLYDTGLTIFGIGLFMGYVIDLLSQ